MAILGQFAYMLAFLAVGVGVRHVGLLDEHRTARLTAFAFYVPLPALIFTSTYDQRLQELISPALLLGFWIVIGVTALVGWAIHRRRTANAHSGVAIVQSYHGNMGFLGLPVVATLLGGEPAAIASVILGIGTLTHNPLTISVLNRANDSNAEVRSELFSLLTNPVIVSLFAGIAVSVSQATPPAPVTAVLEGIGQVALPLALLAVGSSLDTDLQWTSLTETGQVVAVKLLWMPAIGWLVYAGLDVGPAVLAGGVMMLGAPTAVVTYVYTSELGGDVAFASRNVFATTLASLGTMSLLAWLVG